MVNILIVSRGLGWGHSIRDILIINQLKKICKDINFYIISYESGLKCYKFYGLNCFDMNSVNNEGLVNYIENLGLNLIISDEEFIIITIAKKINIPCIFITNFIPFDDKLNLLYSVNKILFTELPDLINKENMINIKDIPIKFIGPICKIKDNSEDNINELKREFGICNNNKIILITLGGRNDIAAVENNIWLINEILDSCETINEKLNFIIINNSYKKINITSNIHNIILVGNSDQLEKYYKISDLIISRGGLTTLWEIASNNAYNLAVPYPLSLNLMEEIYVQKMKERGYLDYIYQYDVNKIKLKNIIESIMNNNNHMKKDTKYVKDLVNQSIINAASEILNLDYLKDKI